VNCAAAPERLHLSPVETREIVLRSRCVVLEGLSNLFGIRTLSLLLEADYDVVFHQPEKRGGYSILTRPKRHVVGIPGLRDSAQSVELS
jgi:hypothetical protein